MFRSSAAAPVVSHDLESPSPFRVVPRRAKVLARPARELSAAIFNRACELVGHSNVVVADWLGVDERRVREMRAGEKPVRLDSMVQLPPSLEEAIGIALIEHSKSRAIVVRGVTVR